MSNFRERTLSPIMVQWKMAKNLKGNQPLGDVYPFFTKNHGAMRGRVTNCFFPQVFMKPFSQLSGMLKSHETMEKKCVRRKKSAESYPIILVRSKGSGFLSWAMAIS